MGNWENTFKQILKSKGFRVSLTKTGDAIGTNIKKKRKRRVKQSRTTRTRSKKLVALESRYRRLYKRSKETKGKTKVEATYQETYFCDKYPTWDAFLARHTLRSVVREEAKVSTTSYRTKRTIWGR